MICQNCRAKRHEDCPGGTWCDCQHKPVVQQADARLNWLRQG
jgi:hypothetical protein